MRFILGFITGAIVYCYLDKTDNKKKETPPAAAPAEPTPETPAS